MEERKLTLHEKYTEFLRTKIEDLEKTDVYDYACEKDFNNLWQLSPLNICHNVPHHIIIVWEKTYGDVDINPLLASCLTPMDWALTYFAKRSDHLAKNSSKPYVVPFVYIVDLTGRVHNEWAMQRTQIESMPWVQLCASLTPQVPVRKNHQPIIAVGEDTDTGEAGPLLLMSQAENPPQAHLNLRKEEGAFTAAEKRTNLIEKKDKFMELAGQLKSSSGSFRSGDHHDINNLIGPALFIRDGVYGALARRVCFDFLSKKKPSFEKFLSAENLKIKNNLRIIVVDDYVEKGWESAFFSYFGAKPSKGPETKFISKDKSIELQCFPDPTGVIDKIEEKINKMPEDPEHLQKCWNYSLFNTNKAQDKAQEILFFDLRLFPRQGDKISPKEKKYFKRACDLATTLVQALAERICDIADNIGVMEEIENRIESSMALKTSTDVGGGDEGGITQEESEIRKRNLNLKIKDLKNLQKLKEKLNKIRGWLRLEELDAETSDQYKALDIRSEVSAIDPEKFINWPNGPISDEEKGYFNRVCNLASDLAEKVPFLEEVKKITKMFRSGNPEDEISVYYKALTLLPRILSTIDPSYPIILFSVTGIRDIVEPVNPYKNIITSFPKPDLDTLSSASKIQASLDIFEDTLRESLKIIRAREHCQKLQEHGPWVPEQHTGNLLNEEYHIELFIDETGIGDDGKPPWRVGGCFALFSGEGAEKADGLKKAQGKADAFDDELIKGGVIYTEYQQRAGGSKIPKEKRQGCAAELGQLLSKDPNQNEKDNRPDKIGLVSMQGKEAEENKNAFISDDNGDRAFLNTLEVLVEGFLYEGLPQIAASIGKNPEDISVSIFAATRVSVKSDDSEEGYAGLLRQARIDNYVAGIKSLLKNRKIVQYSLDQEDFAPIVQRIIGQRELRKITRALAVPLVEQEQNNQVPEKFIKFLCHQCKTCFKAGEFSYEEIINKINEQRDDSMYGLRQNGKLWMNRWDDNPQNKCCCIDLQQIENIQQIEGRTEAENRLQNTKYTPPFVKFDNEFFEKLEPCITPDLSNLEFMETLVGYINTHPARYLPWKTTCPHCKDSNNSPVLDVRALHYVADQILTKCFENPEVEYEQPTNQRRYDTLEMYMNEHNYTVFDKPEVGEFVDVVDNDLIKIMHLSKQIDIGGSVLAKAIADFPLSKTDTKPKRHNESKVANKPSLRKIAAQRAASKLPSLSQDNFFIIVDNLEQKRQSKKATTGTGR